MVIIMRFLFHGDSITDAGRENYDSVKELGAGYVKLLEADLTFLSPDAEVGNAGIGNSRVTDLLPRWRKDCLELCPDVLTILIGINDVCHEIYAQNGVAPELFEEVYNILLRETKAALPDVRIILMGAYVMHGTMTDEYWEIFEKEVRARREITRGLAKRYGADYLDLQEKFDAAVRRIPLPHWTGDGIHPTLAGHRLIAEEWKRVYGI